MKTLATFTLVLFLVINFVNAQSIIEESNNSKLEKSMDVVINVYPNPCVNYINLVGSFNDNSNIEIEVKDAFGEIVFYEVLEEAKLLNESIDALMFPTGIYFVKVVAGNKLHETQIIKI